MTAPAHRLPTGGQIKAMLERLGVALIAELCPGGYQHGAIWSAPNPSRAGDSNSSFKVWLDPGRFGAWREYDAGDGPDSRGDLIQLIALAKNLEIPDAFRWARWRLGIDHQAPEQVARRIADANAANTASDAQAAAKRARQVQRARLIWQAATPILEESSATVAVRHYLHRRAIHLKADFPTLEADEIRATTLEHWTSSQWDGDRKVRDGWTGPAMVCPMRNGAGDITAVHCTFVHEGKKAPVDKPKLIMGSPRGSVIRLTRGESELSVEEACEAGIADTVGLGEGIENTLSVASQVPQDRFWAAGYLTNLQHAPVELQCCWAVRVLRDNDKRLGAWEAFEGAMDALIARHPRVTDIKPDPEYKDFNQWLTQEEKAP